jgi:hypothetical protein
MYWNQRRIRIRKNSLLRITYTPDRFRIRRWDGTNPHFTQCITAPQCMLLATLLNSSFQSFFLSIFMSTIISHTSLGSLVIFSSSQTSLGRLGATQSKYTHHSILTTLPAICGTSTPLAYPLVVEGVFSSDCSAGAICSI